MPNHVINELTISGNKKEVKKVLTAIRGEEEEQFIDFNKIVPMPEELKTVTSPVRIVSEEEFANEMIERHKQLQENPDHILWRTHSITQKMHDEYMKKYGCTDWYDFATTNWGTKWNAYQQSKGETTVSENGDVSEVIYFQTAWSTPYKVMRKLSEMFPKVNIVVKFADEDAGSNCGVYSLNDGEEVDEWMPDAGGKEAMKIYFDLWGGEEDWEYDEKNDSYNFKDN